MTRTILYIEDHPDNALLVQRALEARGYRFLWAVDGYGGIAMAEAEKPDLILLDINLPDIIGHEVARRIRANTHNGLLHVPIIAITADALSTDADRALSAGCNVYMCKPIRIRDLWARVAALLPDAGGAPAPGHS